MKIFDTTHTTKRGGYALTPEGKELIDFLSVAAVVAFLAFVCHIGGW